MLRADERSRSCRTIFNLNLVFGCCWCFNGKRFVSFSTGYSSVFSIGWQFEFKKNKIWMDFAERSFRWIRLRCECVKLDAFKQSHHLQTIWPWHICVRFGLVRFRSINIFSLLLLLLFYYWMFVYFGDDACAFNWMTSSMYHHLMYNLSNVWDSICNL